MEGAGEASAPVPSGNGELTDTVSSGIPVAPVYAGAALSYSFAPMLRSRRQEFRSQQMYRHPDFGTEFRNPYVPRPAGPKGGYDMERHLAGTGQMYEDPLDLFKPQSNTMDKKPQGVKRPNRPSDPSRQRQRGTSAYNKVNKENKDGSDF
jgi:hypothetical protein